MPQSPRPLMGTKKRNARCAANLFAALAVLSAVSVSRAADGLSSLFRPIEFTSRAQCAINASSPTRSILIFGDGQDAGRLAFNLESKSGIVVTEAEALSAYRKSIAFTFKLVVEKLINGEIPLISGATTDPSLLDVLAKCDKQRGCRALETKLSEIWATGLEKAQRSKNQKQGSARLGCHKVNQFTALQGHLAKTRPDHADLEEIARLLVDSGKAPEACDGDSARGDRHFLLQLDLVSISENSFENQGFDFWNSVKTYAAWAWRNAPEVSKSMGRFGALFPNMALEEEIILAPNGCRAISLPKCELQRLSLDAIRELAKPPGAKSGFETNLPNGPQSDLIARGVRGVNNGFLGTSSADAQTWVKNFSNRFNEARWASRNKLQGAIRTASLLEKISNETIVRDIESDLNLYKAAQNTPLTSQMAAVCLEAQVLEDPTVKALRPDFENVMAVGSDLIPEVASARITLKKVAATAVDLAKRLRPLCAQLEKSIFKSRSSDTKTYNYNYVSDWARERLVLPLSDEETKLDASTRRSGWARPEIYLKLASSEQAPVEICRSPLACAQLAFKSYADIYYVSMWASALQNTRKMKDSNLFNPYSELATCKIYDPWFATEQANAMLTQRLVVSAVSAPLPVPVFFESAEKRPKAVAMQSSLTTNLAGAKDLKFEAAYATEDSKKTFFADLGPLTGAPCAIQYANENAVPFQVYGISGVTVNYCSDGKKSKVSVEDDGSSSSGAAKYSICGGCTVNATSALSMLSFAAVPGPIRFVFGAMRAFGLYADATQDAVNRPITYTVNPDYVADAYRENSLKIPTACTESLSNGYRCFNDVCAAHAANDFEKRSGLRVSTSSIRYDDQESGSVHGTTRNGVVGIKIEQCDAEIMANVRCDASKRRYEILNDFFAFSSSCRQIVSNMKAAAK